MEMVLVRRVFLRRFSDASSPLLNTKVSQWYAGQLTVYPLYHYDGFKVCVSYIAPFHRCPLAVAEVCTGFSGLPGGPQEGIQGNSRVMFPLGDNVSREC